ncbi:TolC family protein [Chondrinema litorale]|uniref:TolC family protein n=1 Tax=Chondrinema litorale TaxID=2994555 RepID=UPI002542A912|nr:TolC family protein [Chondrinema litorale]UZR98524.1 TolC family protein [Chondrinema litorale]
MSKLYKIGTLKFLIVLLIPFNSLKAQQLETLSLEQAIEAALENNNLLRIKKLQVQEQEAKIKEADIIRYPKVQTSAQYQYNFEIGQITIPAGSFGTLPLDPTTSVSLPDVERSFEVTNHNNLNLGVSVYQPLTQLGKINTGVRIAQINHMISVTEQNQVKLQIINGVEQYFYAILAVKKRMEEAEKNIEVAKLKLYDVESALMAGKTVQASQMGLKADIANQQQELLILSFEEEDLIAELKTLTGLKQDQIVLSEVDVSLIVSEDLSTYQLLAKENNSDLKLLKLQNNKSELAIKAAKQSFLPDLGIITGYNYQKGMDIMPESNPYIGASFSWDIQNTFSNRQVLKQRKLLQEQALENEKYTQTQIVVSVEKAFRKMKQSEELVLVAKKAVSFREAELKIENDKKETGLAEPIKVLEIEAELAKSKADLYAAIMSFKIAESELKLLTKI